MKEEIERICDEVIRQGSSCGWGQVSADRWNAVKMHAGPTVLDVGCSSGNYVLRLLDEGYDVYGIDLMFYSEWQAFPGRFQVGVADCLPYHDEAFETLLCFEVLEHVSDPVRVLDELYRVSAGNLILTVPDCETPEILRSSGLTYHHWIDRTHIRFYTLETIAELVSNSGFAVESIVKINRVRLSAPLWWSLGFGQKMALGLDRLLQRLPTRKLFFSLLVVAKKR